MSSSFRKNKATLWWFVLLYFIPFLLSAQNSVNEKSLIDVLRDVEKQYDIRFSYTKPTVVNLFLVPPKSDLSLQEAIAYLKTNTQLEFTLIGTRYIAVHNAVQSGDLSICGKLINVQTGRPVGGATILGASAAVGTDDAGFFQLDGISRGEVLRISYLGFELKKLKSDDLIGTDNCPLIFVSVSVNFLDTVILESFIAKGISKNADGSVSISKQNFEILPSLVETDVLQIAQILPGVESTDETAANINIRAGKNDEVLLLWDDVRMYQSSHFFGLISALNPNLTNEVTIYKNGTHPRFGESTSGVISIASDSEVPEKVSGGAGINLISANLYAKIPAGENFAVTLSGRTSINSGIGNPVYDQFYSRIFQNTIITNLNNNTAQGLRSSNENFNFYDLSVKGVWDFTKNDKLSYSFLGINNTLEFTELFVAENTTSSNQSKLEQSSNVNGVQWQRNWSPKWSSKIQWDGSNYVLEESNREVNTDVTSALENEIKEREFKSEVTFRLNSSFLTTAGYTYTDTQLTNRSDSLVSEKSVLRRSAYFLNSQWKINEERTIVSGGVRFTRYPSFGKNFTEPRIALFQRLDKNLNLSLSGELKHQGVLQFTAVENPFLGVENKRWILADNEELPILQSEQFAFGATFKKKDWTVTTEVYYKKVDNVSSATQGFRNQFISSESIGSYDAMGFELSVNKKSKNWNAWLSYSFTDSDYNFPELTPSTFHNSFAITHTANIALTHNYRSFQFSLGSTFKSGNPFTTLVDGNEIVLLDNDPTLNFSLPNEATLNAYFRTDFSAVYEFRLDDTFQGKINLALLNIFDRKNALETYYLLQTDENGSSTVNKVEQFSLGFTPNISFQLLF